MNRRDWEGSAKRKTDFMGPLESATVKNIQTKPPGAGPAVRFA